MIFSKNPSFFLFFFSKRRSDVPLVPLAKAEQIPEARHSTATYCAREIFFPSAKAIPKDNAPGVTKWNLRKRNAAMAVQSKSLPAGETIHFTGFPARCVCFIINGKISMTDAIQCASPEYAAVQFQRVCR